MLQLGKLIAPLYNLDYSNELRARAECSLHAFQKDTRVWKDQHTEAETVRTHTVHSSSAVCTVSGLVSDSGILLPAKCIGLPSVQSSAPLGAESPTSVGISLQAPGRLLVALGALQWSVSATSTLQNLSTSCKILLIFWKISLQLCCRRCKKSTWMGSSCFS